MVIVTRPIGPLFVPLNTKIENKLGPKSITSLYLSDVKFELLTYLLFFTYVPTYLPTRTMNFMLFIAAWTDFVNFQSTPWSLSNHAHFGRRIIIFHVYSITINIPVLTDWTSSDTPPLVCYRYIICYQQQTKSNQRTM